MDKELKLPATEAMKLAVAMLQPKVIAQVSGKHREAISSGINHCMFNGKPHWFTQDDCVCYQEALHTIGRNLQAVRIEEYPQFETDSPYCYGVDNIEKIKNLCKVVKRNYLFVTVLGRTKTWADNRLSCGNARKLSFSREDIQALNDAVRVIADRLMSMELVCEIDNQNK